MPHTHKNPNNTLTITQIKQEWRKTFQKLIFDLRTIFLGWNESDKDVKLQLILPAYWLSHQSFEKLLENTLYYQMYSSSSRCHCICLFDGLDMHRKFLCSEKTIIQYPRRLFQYYLIVPTTYKIPVLLLFIYTGWGLIFNCPMLWDYYIAP